MDDGSSISCCPDIAWRHDPDCTQGLPCWSWSEFAKRAGCTGAQGTAAAWALRGQGQGDLGEGIRQIDGSLTDSLRAPVAVESYGAKYQVAGGANRKGASEALGSGDKVRAVCRWLAVERGGKSELDRANWHTAYAGDNAALGDA